MMEVLITWLFITAITINPVTSQDLPPSPTPPDAAETSNDYLVPPTPSELPELPADYGLPSGNHQVLTDSGDVCILADFAATIEIRYKSTNGSELSLTDTLSPDAKWDGTCSADKPPVLRVRWHNDQCILTLTFNKDEREWFASAISYQYTKSTSQKFVSPTERKVVVSGCPKGSKHFTSPLGQYHSCDTEPPISLPQGTADIVTLSLTGVKIQAYNVPKSGNFEDSPSHKCAASRSSSSSADAAATAAKQRTHSTAAVAVGICVALITVGVVVGYAGRRYYRERISYSTMQ